MMPPVSEARKRLIAEAADVFAYPDEHDASMGVVLDALLARPADLIAVVIETLTCETCGGIGKDREWRCGCGRGVRHVVDCGRPPPDKPCSDCNGSKLDPVKVQAMLRQFADAGVLTEETRRLVKGRVGLIDGRYLATEKRFVSGWWVPLGAPE